LHRETTMLYCIQHTFHAKIWQYSDKVALGEATWKEYWHGLKQENKYYDALSKTSQLYMARPVLSNSHK